MKEWFIFSKIISCSIVSIILLAYYLDCYYVVCIFSVFSFMTFLLTITTFLIIISKNGTINQMISCCYIDLRRYAMWITDTAYSSYLPADIISENERKMSYRLRKIRECIIRNYVSSWWAYISPTRQFEIQVRLRLSRILENVIARFKVLPYSQLITTVIRLKVGFKRATGSASMRRLAEIDPEKYFASAFFEMLPFVLEEEESNVLPLREWLADMLASSVAIPLLDLIQDPHIIFNAVIALLARDQQDIAIYVAKVQLARRGPNTDNKINEPLLLPKSLRSALSSMSATEGLSLPSSKNNDSSCSHRSDSHHTISNIHISDTFRSTDVKSGSQFTMYIIKFVHIVSTSKVQLTNSVKIVHRRYKEFINLHHMLSDLPEYKGIRGPSSLDQMFLHNFSPARINVRKDFLENYLRSLVERPGLVNHDIVHRFLGISKFSADQPFENVSRPLNVKIKKKWNDLMEKISDRLPDMHSDKDYDSSSDRDDNRTGNESNDPQDEINKMLTSLSKLSCHQNPAFPCHIPEFEYQHPLIQANFRHLTDNYLSLCQESSTTAPAASSTTPCASTATPEPPITCPEPSPRSTGSRVPVSYKSSPFTYGPNDPVPFLLSFRQLALQYRDSTCQGWRPHEGPALTRTGGWLAPWERLAWAVLGVAADPIIQWSFEDLLRACHVADYLDLFQELLWPSGRGTTKGLATFDMDCDLGHLRQAASQAIADALPNIAYLFVDKRQLTDLIDAVLEDFQSPQSNRLFLFQLLQIVLEEHLFRDAFNPANH